jgi:hypothetical protein
MYMQILFEAHLFSIATTSVNMYVTIYVTEGNRMQDTIAVIKSNVSIKICVLLSQTHCLACVYMRL